ncbi:homing endonuclease associated repeat-containing protein [Exiguobacterium sp. TDN 0502]|uniref:homing endonuclease associated repeat-containing protein n=1 Tax=Exiguobacterium sp. TDN 0502 TaxID=3420731 RepID=UPI003D774F21
MRQHPTSTSTLATDEKIIRLIQGLHQMHHSPMKATHYQKLAAQLPYPSLEEINARFGSWTQLLERAGIIDATRLSSKEQLVLNRPAPVKRANRWTIEESVAFYVAQKGTNMTIRSYTELRDLHTEMMSANTIIRRFGTWKNALTHFHLTSNGIFSDQDCLEALKQAAETHGPLLTSQQYAKWARAHHAPSLTLLIERFSSWREALRRLDL